MKELEQRKVIRQFLLGELPDERRQQVEEKLMIDGDYRDEVLMVESELVEEYLTQALSSDERGKFDKHYLSAPRQQKNVRLTKALFKAAQSAKPIPAPNPGLLRTMINFFQSGSPRMRLATASLILLVVLGAGVLFQAWRLRFQTGGLGEEVAQLNTPENMVSPSNSVPSVTLLPVSVREQGALPKLTVSPAAKVVQLRVPIESNTYQNYRLELRTIEGEQIVEFIAKKQIGEALVVQLPARILRPNDYVLVVNGLTGEEITENLGEYSFRVLQQ